MAARSHRTPSFRTAEINCGGESIFFLLVEQAEVEKNKLKSSLI